MRQQLLGPKAFPVERMLAIFYSIIDDKLDDAIDIPIQVNYVGPSTSNILNPLHLTLRFISLDHKLNNAAIASSNYQYGQVGRSKVQVQCLIRLHPRCRKKCPIWSRQVLIWFCLMRSSLCTAYTPLLYIFPSLFVNVHCFFAFGL